MIVIAGAPGCGKSTQVAILTKEGYQGASTSQILREGASPEVLAQMSRGELVDIDYTNQLVGAALDGLSQDYNQAKIILDGFPRALKQATWLIEEHQADLELYILLEASRETLCLRLADRQRGDDTPQAIKRRLDLFDKNTQPLLNYLETRAIKLQRVNAEQTVSEVTATIKASLAELGHAARLR